MPSLLTRVRALIRGSPGFVHYLFAFVFLIRIVVLARLSSSPYLLPNGSDMQFYDEWARQILRGQLTDHQAFYGLPLYPYLVALLYRLFGASPFVPGLFQACLDAGTAVLLYKATVHILTSARTPAAGLEPRNASFVGLAAAAGWAFFIPAQAYSAILMPTSAAVFAFWLVVWRVARTETAPSRLSCLLLGCLIGFTAMGVATILFLVPLVITAIWVKGRRPESGTGSRVALRSAASALLLAGVVAGTSPCWIHNYFVARDPVFLSAHGGINLWLGNNPGANGYPRFPGLHAGQAQMLRDSIDLAETAAGRTLKRSEVSRYWSSKARDYIRRHQVLAVRLLARKISNFWNAFQYDDVGIIASLREHGILFPGLRFGFLAVLAIPGFLFSWRAFPVSRWIAAAVALNFVAILPVFVTERYRLAVVPGLLIFAALGLCRFWQHCASANYRMVPLQVGVIVASAMFVTLPRPDRSLWAHDAYNSGRLALETQNFPAAEYHLQRAHSLVPENSEIKLALGNLRFAQGDPAAARNFYEAVLKIEPHHKGALNNLGVLALNENQPGTAAEYFRLSLAQEPRNAKTHYLLAKALVAIGNERDARIEAAHAVELDPNQPEFKALNDQLSGNKN
jgi:tetratricopeptide (TPR) repeat protein